MERFIYAMFNLLVWPGFWLPWIVGHFKKMGDGNGNESGMIECFLWMIPGAIVTWAGVALGIIYLVQHLQWV